MVDHTPGPWRIVADDDPISGDVSVVGPQHVCGENGPTQYIATLHGYTDDSVEFNSTNAALVSAAPDLLAALKALHLQALQSTVNSQSNEWGQEALHMALHAIAKAEGRHHA